MCLVGRLTLLSQLLNQATFTAASSVIVQVKKFFNEMINMKDYFKQISS